MAAHEGAVRGLTEQFFSGGIALQASFEQVIGESQHAAAGVVDQDEFAGVEQVVRNDEAANRIVGHHASGIADDVRIASLQAQQVLDVEPRIHAGHERFHSVLLMCTLLSLFMLATVLPSYSAL